MKDELLDEIRQVKKHCTSDEFDYEDGYGEIKNLVYEALDIADELREAVLVAHKKGHKLVYGKDIPGHYKLIIVEQINKILSYLGG